ncbi:MAG: S8 family peptidase [Chloroflexota bacterium]|nr:S8 family peptidase [Chloroflexota bacterium]
MQMLASPTQMLPVIVQVNAATPPFAAGVNVTLAQQALNILRTNGQVVGALPIINAAAGWADAAAITAMSLLPQVAEIDQDAPVQPRRSTATGASWPPGSLTSLYVQEVNANSVWQQGGSGRGVTVAVLDSGVSPDLDLTRTSNRILASVGFAGPTSASSPDPGGHGTHIAGIIAGDGTRSAGQYVGMAPGANIVSVQVLDANGNGRVSSILRGLDWVIAHQAQYNIRIVNMSFGAIAQGSYITDPMAAGVEVAWTRGLVVVAAAGNGGPSSGTVDTPGIDPYAITVGSSDDRGTLTLADDVLGWWSSWSSANGSTSQKPDLVAPGRRLVSLYVPGSTLSALLPDHLVTARNGSTYFRLTGTSMSTAVVSGAVALLLEHQPGLTPDQVKKILTTTSQAFGQGVTPSQPGSAGAGLLNAVAAFNGHTSAGASKVPRPANGLTRALYPAIYGQPLVWNNLNYLGGDWQNLTWTSLIWNGVAWDNIAWDNIAWDNIAWDKTSWDNIAWDKSGWDNIAWDGIVSLD